MFPTLDAKPQPDVRMEKAPMIVGAADPATRDREGADVVASAYEPLEPKFDQFKALVSGRFKLLLKAQCLGRT